MGKRPYQNVFVGIFISCLIIVLSLFLTAAQDATNPTIKTADNKTYGSYLTDTDGNSLYMFANDSENTSSCSDQCAATWPPYTVEGEPVAGDSVESSLIGTITREDGSTQVTYNGLPLYLYSKDQKPGDTGGESVGDTWYLVSVQGAPVEKAGDNGDNTDNNTGDNTDNNTDASLAQLTSEGQKTFASICSECHGKQGQGGVGARLVGDSNLKDTKHVVDTITKGLGYMPAIGADFSNKQVAEVATFIRNSFGNNFGIVSEGDVEKYR